MADEKSEVGGYRPEVVPPVAEPSKPNPPVAKAPPKSAKVVYKLVPGWNKDHPDASDYKLEYLAPSLMAVALPSHSNMLGLEPDIWDQGQLGSCTAHASLRAFEIEQTKQGLGALGLSRLMAYYTARKAEGDPGQDNGAQIRDVIKGLAKVGCCPEEEWPYLIEDFAEAPSGKAYTDALAHTAKYYAKVTNSRILNVKAAIAAKLAVAFGFEVPQEFEGDEMASTGTMEWPSEGAESIGGHAVCAIGYDDTFICKGEEHAGALLVTNSWGEKWGQNGHFWMPYRVATSARCSDFWTISQVGYGPSLQIE